MADCFRLCKRIGRFSLYRRVSINFIKIFLLALRRQELPLLNHSLSGYYSNHMNTKSSPSQFRFDNVTISPLRELVLLVYSFSHAFLYYYHNNVLKACYLYKFLKSSRIYKEINKTMYIIHYILHITKCTINKYTIRQYSLYTCCVAI